MTAWTTPKTWAKRDVLLAADLNKYVSDNTLHLKERVDGGMNKVIQTVTGGSYTIASGTFADIAGGLNIASFTPRSASSTIMIALRATFKASVGPSDNLSIDFNIDGTRMGNATYGSFMLAVAHISERTAVYYTKFTTLTAVTHSIKPQWRRDGGTTWTLETLNGQSADFMVWEL